MFCNKQGFQYWQLKFIICVLDDGKLYCFFEVTETKGASFRVLKYLIVVFYIYYYASAFKAISKFFTYHEIDIYIRIYRYIFTNRYVHIYMYAHVYRWTYLSMCLYIYIYIYIYNWMKTQTWLNCHYKFFSAKNIIFVSSDYLQVYGDENY